MYDPDVGGPDQLARYSVYTAAGLSERTKTHVEQMVLGSGRRPVGKGALSNVVTRFDSAKNAMPRVLESHTCESIHALELELDPEVLGYYTQVLRKGIVRIKPDGRKHVSSAHLDFLILRKSKIELVECKQVHWLQKKSGEEHSEWCHDGTTWTNEAYQRWAEQNGLPFRTWVAPKHPAIYSQNLAAIYDTLRLTPQPYELRACDEAMRKLEQGPLTLAELVQSVPTFSARNALILLGSASAFGPTRSVSICREGHFYLFADSAQARHFEILQEGATSDHMTSLGKLHDPLLTASSTDLTKARLRLKKVMHVQDGLIQPNGRTASLVRKVQAAQAKGQSTLAACLTSYHCSGNRLPRISDEHLQLVQQVITKYWDSGKVTRACDLEFVFENECNRVGLPIAGLSRLNNERRKRNPLRHALATGGMRAYQSIRPNTDPRFTSTAPAGFGSVAHIDSTPIDMRFVSFDGSQGTGLQLKANFYIAIDGAAGYPIGYALIFGPSRTDGLAVLFREIVRRNGFLPRMVHVDRGPENTSRWMREFCESRTSIRFSPTAGSAWNQLAETVMRYVNEQVSHRLFGSTLPDRFGRAVDGRYKSIKTAKMQFVEVIDLIRSFLYERLIHIPAPTGGSPAERREDCLARLGPMGEPCQLDESFLIRTSVSVDRIPKPTPKGSLRLEEGSYTSGELQDWIRRGIRLTDVRMDCEDPSILYVRSQEGWVKAFHRQVQMTANESADERLFELCFGSRSRSGARKIKKALARQEMARLELAKTAAVNRPKPQPSNVPQLDPAVERARESASNSIALYGADDD